MPPYQADTRKPHQPSPNGERELSSQRNEESANHTSEKKSDAKEECINSEAIAEESNQPLDRSNSLEEEDFVAIELVETNDGPIPPEQSIQEESVAADQEAASLEQEQQHLLPRSEPPRQIKQLHHPLLTPITRVPWHKVVSAAASCDLLFNCKYSMRQVEDEVREEKRVLTYPNAAAVDDDECEEFDPQELGLHCCSMLDSNEKEQQQQGPNVMDEEERAKKSWKGMSPSLDMMLCRQFLDE